MNTGIVAAGRLQSLIDSRDYSRDVLELKVQLAKISQAVRSVVPESMWGPSSSSSRSWSSTRRRSTSGRTPSMTLTTSPSTRPSSSTMTTSFDLRSRVTEGDGTAAGVNAAFAVRWTQPESDQIRSFWH